MVDALYARAEATAARLIAKYGKASKIVREGAPSGPPHAPVPGADVEHDCVLVETKYDIANRDATLVAKGDKLGIISPAVDVVPLLSDRIRIDGKLHQLADVQPLNPGGLVVLYKFHAKA